jgi:uncharacterized RDD family membrane protein YckC
LLGLIYEGVLLIAVLFLSSYLFLSLARDAQAGWSRTIFQLFLLCVCGAYFVFCWTRSGQTLPMKTWHLRLVAPTGEGVTPIRALRRYLFAVPGMLSGVSVLWALVDKERQFLHDRLAGTRIVRIEKQ